MWDNSMYIKTFFDKVSPPFTHFFYTCGGEEIHSCYEGLSIFRRDKYAILPYKEVFIDFKRWSDTFFTARDISANDGFPHTHSL